MAVVAALLVTPPSALAGGDEEQQAPPSAGPPGPWNGPSGEQVPYRPSGTRRCPGASAEDPPTLRDRVEELQQELDSLAEEVEDLQEPVGEFDLFDECMYPIGVSEYGSADGAFGYLFGAGGGVRRPALAIDIDAYGAPRYQFLAFPAEEPPSIECNEDAGQELIDN